jgi:hypothetical protein
MRRSAALCGGSQLKSTSEQLSSQRKQEKSVVAELSKQLATARSEYELIVERLRLMSSTTAIDQLTELLDRRTAERDSVVIERDALASKLVQTVAEAQDAIILKAEEVKRLAMIEAAQVEAEVRR